MLTSVDNKILIKEHLLITGIPKTHLYEGLFPYRTMSVLIYLPHLFLTREHSSRNLFQYTSSTGKLTNRIGDDFIKNAQVM